MEKEEFEKIVAEEFPQAIPERFRHLLKNVAFIVEDNPSPEIREEQELKEGETLLALYTGTPLTFRGEGYGIGETVPDTIHLYQLPIEREAEMIGGGDPSRLASAEAEENIRRVIRETIWHEVAHHFGFDDEQVEERERRRE